MLILKATRVVLVVVYFLIAAAVGSVISLFRPFNPDNTRVCGRIFGRGGLWLLGVHYKVEGTEILDQMAPSVIVANHQDNLDLFVFGNMIPSRTVSIGKKSLMYLPLFGQVYWLSGNIMIDRSNRSASINALQQTTDAIQKDRKSIWVFPEGTRSHGKGLGNFKKGAFHMALTAGAPILPICSSTYSGKLKLGNWRSGTILVKVLPPVPTEGLDAEQLVSLIETTRNSMQKTVEELDARVEAIDSRKA